MSTPVSNKIALFIDGANLYATAKTLGFDIDYKRLLKEFQGRGTLLRAFYYTAIIEDQEYSSIRPLIDWLDYNGYTVVTKATKEFIDASELQCDWQLRIDPDVPAPAPEQAMAVFRIFQELLSNVGRHAQASAVRICIEASCETLCIEIADNGRGAARAAFDSPRAYGVLGMRERAGHHGGRIEIDSTPGQGTRVRLMMPLAAAKECLR